MSNKNIFEDLLKETGNEYASIVEHGVEAGDVTGYVNTGSLALNALISGSIYGGIPDSKVTAFAGVSGVGKSYFSLNVVREFLKTYRDGFVYYFESESAISKDMFASRGIDIKRTAILPVSTIQEFRTQALKILNRYLEMGEDRPRILLVLDSLGNLSSEKELQDISDGKDTRDMTKAQLIRAAFRVLTLKLGKAKVPLIVTAHTYAEIGCAVSGTMISTPTGFIPIESVMVGDEVNTMVGKKSVTETYSYDAQETFLIEFEDGFTVELTPDHKLMKQNGEWTKVSNLNEEDIVVGLGKTNLSQLMRSDSSHFTSFSNGVVNDPID